MNRRLEISLLGLMLGLAAVLRMGWPGLTEFKRDEAHLYALALGVARFESFPLRGLDFSVGLPNSPVSVYLYALPLFVWRSPLAATLFVGALNTASVALAYAMMRRYWGTRAALLAALLYAAAPWAVIHSRKLWSNNLLPLFVTGCIFAGVLALVEGRRGWLLAHFGLLALAVSIHVSAIALAPATLVLLAVFHDRVDWRPVGWVAGAVGIAALAGWMVLAQTGVWPRLLTFLLAHPLQWTPQALSYAALMIQGTYLHSLAGPEAFRAFLATVPDLEPVLWLGGCLVLLGAGYCAGRWAADRRASPHAPRSGRHDVGLALAVWLVFPVLFYVPHLTPVYPHYLIILFPTSFLLSAVFLEALLTRFRATWQQVLVWLAPIVIAVTQVWLLVSLLRFVGAHNTPDAFGTPLGILLEVARAAQHFDAGGVNAHDVIVVGDGADPAVHTIPAVFDALLHDTPHRFVDGRATAVFPVGAALAVVWPGEFPGVDLYRQWGGGEWWDTVPLRSGEGAARIAAGPGTAPVVPRPREASASLSNGAEVLGSGGDARQWELWWLAPGPVEGEAYHMFAHLLDAHGERSAQVDQATYAPLDWRAGDLVVSYFALQGEGVLVRAGMYAYPSLAPVSVLDAQGEPSGQWIEFPLGMP